MYLHRLVGATLGNKYCVWHNSIRYQRRSQGGSRVRTSIFQAVADLGGVHPPHQRYLISDIIKFLTGANDKNFGGEMLS